MHFDEAMEALRKAGTEQNRKVYARHGVGDKQFGVSYANLRALAKKVKSDQALAERLWATGNHDARVLAMMVADPKAVTARQLDQWARDLDNYVLTDAFSVLVAKTPHAKAIADRWTAAKGEWVGSAGWNVVCHLAMFDKDLPDAYFEDRLAVIESEIHSRKNRVRHAMNGALISIGARGPALTKQVFAAAGRIGKVEVDHGETGCKTPDAADYIRRMLDRKKKR